MASRGQSVTITYVAWDTANKQGKTGDSANHTLKWIKDGTAASPTNAASEVDSTNAPGVYKLTLTSAEATCDVGVITGKSSTSGIVIIPTTVTFENAPTAAPGASSGLPIIGSSPLTNLDAAVTTRLASASYTAPDNTTIATIAARLGAFTGSGVNTVLGFFKALLSKVATLPSDVGGTFDPSTDSVEALRDRGDAAWTPPGSVVLASNGLDSVVVESGINARQALAGIGAVLAGTCTGGGTGTVAYTGMGNATTRVTGTCPDDYGNRTAVALNLPA